MLAKTPIHLRVTVVSILAVAAGNIPPAFAQDQAGQPPSFEAVAILAFTNLGGDPALDWVGPGTVASLVADLGSLGVRTVPPAAVQAALADRDITAAGLTSTAADVGSVLGTRWVIFGSYQRIGAHLRLTARLYDSTTGTEVATARSEGLRENVFDLQDQIAAELGAQIRPRSRVSDNAASVLPSTSDLQMPTPVIDGPPPPQSPAVISRDAAGRATIRASRVTEPLRIDGTLDERVYQDVLAISDFIQTEPIEGVPSSEQTEVWVLFDRDYLYVSGRCWDSAPESEWIVNEMRRDSMNILQNENFAFLIDTFYDRRNGVLFQVNPIGGRMDGQITDERNWNGDWNPIWNVQPGRFEGGWTFEAAIPFRSLRYRPGREQTWGLQLRRRIRWKNELSYITRIPASVGNLGAFQASLAATLVGIEVPDGGRNIEIKPYAITDLTTDRTTVPEVSNAFGGNVGLDLKYNVTQNLVTDLTVNTDFAQVEADEQQVNLTRFSLFFPEKREFFLENQGLFGFGGGRTGPFGNGNAPVLFYSRRIGLQDGREVPMQLGGRLTGRIGRFSLGVMNVQTGDEPVTGTRATNFSVVRLKRDLLRRSSIGMIFTGRSVSTLGTGSSETYGLDGTFSFYDNLNINTYWAQTSTPGSRDDDVSYRAQLDYSGDRYGVELEHLIVGDDFNPEVGFLRRDDFERSFGSFRFSPRPQSIAAIRKLSWEGRFDYFANRAGVVETRLAQGRFGIEFENSDRFNVEFTQSYEFLEEPFEIASDVTIPVGGYSFQDVLTSFEFGRQRRISGRLSAQHGGFYSGTKTSVEFGVGGGGFRGGSRLELTPRLSVEPGLSLNWLDLAEGQFTTQLVTARTTYTVTPLMFVSALLQGNASNHSLGANIRFRWEYQPGSELFVVYNEQRDTLTPRFPELENRAFIIKVNRLFRF